MGDFVPLDKQQLSDLWGNLPFSAQKAIKLYREGKLDKVTWQELEDRRNAYLKSEIPVVPKQYELNNVHTTCIAPVDEECDNKRCRTGSSFLESAGQDCGQVRSKPSYIDDAINDVQ